MMPQTSTPLAAPRTEKRITVGVGDAGVSSDRDAVLVTHALGSCLGVVLHDPVARVAGLFHPMLPHAREVSDRLADRPYACVDTGFPIFYQQVLKAGGRRERLVTKVAGGSRMFGTEKPDHFDIGRRNFIALRKALWKAGLLIKAECTGQGQAQTVFVHVDSGRVLVAAAGETREL